MAEIQNIDRDMVRLEEQFRKARSKTKGKGSLTISTESKKRRPKR